MYNQILTWFLLLISGIFSLTSAQTHRFIYELKYKQDSLQPNYESTEMILDINSDGVKFYDYGFLEKDSLNILHKTTNNQYFSRTMQTIKRGTNSFKNNNYKQILLSPFNYYVFETDDPINWVIKKETSKLGNLTIQKATANFGGRKWIAWFTKEIPFSEGPYKFRGLPGLIVLLEDSNKNFVYTFSRNYNLKNVYKTDVFLENHYNLKALPITEKQWIKLNIEYFNDPYADLRNSYQPGWDIEIQGKKINSKEDFKELTKVTQQEIIKMNNPLEISKAIQYLDK
ncbi:GLPGLI family protein [Chryseobacterium sp.]|uniref:GLPGLI family protein n=1 Tax=Chryseobacterium sp. TaxID=1871047 RepID=UPI00289CCF51|nr:GLPGLI family protein [Chryseobacterium sp.]